MEENEKRRNVELAYLSLMLSGKKVSECELASEVLKISRAKGEKSLAMLVQSSIKIRAPHRNQPVYRPVQTNRYPTRVRLDRSSSYASSYAF